MSNITKIKLPSGSEYTLSAESIESIKSGLGIVFDTDVASQDVAAGYIVIWKNRVLRAKNNISNGEALSDSKFNSVAYGELNKIIDTLASKKNTQTAKSSPTASGSTSAFIDTISQNANGEITATKKNVYASDINLHASSTTKVSEALASRKTTQTAKTSPTASGTALAFIDTISQDTNGEITATKKNVLFDTTFGDSVTNTVNSVTFAFKKDKYGMVYVNASKSTGAATSASSFANAAPEGYRPANTQILACETYDNNYARSVVINSQGTITIRPAASGNGFSFAACYHL